jgi:hypothetical protein
MKNRLFIMMCLTVAIGSCSKNRSEVVPAVQAPEPQSSQSNVNLNYAYRTTQDSVHSRFISTSIANQMINSYIYSITQDTTQNDDIKSFSISADSLRLYLSNSQIKNVKLIFGHTMEYITLGNSGVYSGMKSGALTIIIAGYDSAGNYIYQGECVLDHALPCPFSCPPGDAGGNLLQ